MRALFFLCVAILLGVTFIPSSAEAKVVDTPWGNVYTTPQYNPIQGEVSGIPGLDTGDLIVAFRGENPCGYGYFVDGTTYNLHAYKLEADHDTDEVPGFSAGDQITFKISSGGQEYVVEPVSGNAYKYNNSVTMLHPFQTLDLVAVKPVSPPGGGDNGGGEDGDDQGEDDGGSGAVSGGGLPSSYVKSSDDAGVGEGETEPGKAGELADSAGGKDIQGDEGFFGPDSESGLYAEREARDIYEPGDIAKARVQERSAISEKSGRVGDQAEKSDRKDLRISKASDERPARITKGIKKEAAPKKARFPMSAKIFLIISIPAALAAAAKKFHII